MRRSREQRPFMTEIKRSRLNAARHPGMMSGDQSEFPIDEPPSDLPEVDINQDAPDPGLEAALAAADAVFGKKLADPVSDPPASEALPQAEPVEIPEPQSEPVAVQEPRVLPSLMNIDPLAKRLAEAENQEPPAPKKPSQPSIRAPRIRVPKNPSSGPRKPPQPSIRAPKIRQPRNLPPAPIQVDIKDLIAERSEPPAPRLLSALSTRAEQKNTPVRYFFNPRRIGVAQRMARKTTQKETLPLRAGERWKRRLSVYAR